jgi:hypothetical protein
MAIGRLLTLSLSLLASLMNAPFSTLELLRNRKSVPAWTLEMELSVQDLYQDTPLGI